MDERNSSARLVRDVGLATVATGTSRTYGPGRSGGSTWRSVAGAKALDRAQNSGGGGQARGAVGRSRVGSSLEGRASRFGSIHSSYRQQGGNGDSALRNTQEAVGGRAGAARSPSDSQSISRNRAVPLAGGISVQTSFHRCRHGPDHRLDSSGRGRCGCVGHGSRNRARALAESGAAIRTRRTIRWRGYSARDRA